MKPAPGKEPEEQPTEDRDDAAAAAERESEDHPHEWDTPGSIEQFETHNREHIA
jgi:hypothetical protein